MSKQIQLTERKTTMQIQLTERKVTIYIDPDLNALVKTRDGDFMGVSYLGLFYKKDEVEIVQPSKGGCQNDHTTMECT